MMNITSFADANKASVDTLFGLSGQALHGVDQLATLNLQVIKTVLAEFAEASQAALAAKSPADLVTLQTAALQSAPEKALAYGRQVQQIYTDATAGQQAAAEAQVADVQSKFLDAVTGAFKNAPGSENAVALVKSAVVAANNAYEGVNKASKQVAEAITANVAQATETAVTTSRSASKALSA